MEEWNGYVDMLWQIYYVTWTGGNGHGGVKWICGHKPTKVCLNKLFHKLCLVDGLVLEYIEWKVYLTEGNNFDPIEIICVVE